MKVLDNLAQQDKDLLLKAPALVSIFAVSAHTEISKAEKDAAVSLAHLRTFTSEPILRPYYEEVEKVFDAQLKELIQMFIPMNEFSKQAIKKKMDNINQILEKLDPDFAKALKKSLHTYAKHVSTADRNVFEYFLLPLNYPGLTD